MLRRHVWQRVSLHNRRRWEQRIASVLSDSREGQVDSAANRFHRIYRERRYTPVEAAFPLLDKARWASLPGETPQEQATPTAGEGGALSTRSSGPGEATYLLHSTFLGPQNAGKTSLVNALALSQVGAVSNRYGSTKDWTKAVATIHQTQLLLLDTPGVVMINSQQDRKRHGVSSGKAWDSIFCADLVVLVLPIGLGFVETEHKRIAREVVQRAASRDLPIVLALTMMDRMQTPKHRELYFSMRADLESMNLPISATHEVSVKDGKGLVELKDCLSQYAVQGTWEHSRRESTDLSPVDRVAEFLRQIYFEILPHEIPHLMRQRIIGWTRKDSGTTEVVVEVFFDRPGYMFTFYSKLETICLRAQRLTANELGSRFRFVFQAFTSPSSLSHR
ncbi:unnamed protein product [Phytomonas sp. Hart1]|nr:unnamed protein product [Phytomonas sp. Hart1]|eukprot:CCW70864.1 unnamed protein product [Phytomonas sp. isolate Hart1]